MDVFFLNCIDHPGLGPSAHCLKVVDHTTVVTPFIPYVRHHPGLCFCLKYLHLFLVMTVLLGCFLPPKPIFLMSNCIKVS